MRSIPVSWRGDRSGRSASPQVATRKDNWPGTSPDVMAGRYWSGDHASGSGRTEQFALAFLQFPRPALARRHRRGGGVISRRARQYRPEHLAPRRQPDPGRWSLSALKRSSVSLAGEKRRPPDRAGRASDEDLCCPERKSSSGSHGAISVAGRPIIVRERQKRGQS